VSIALKRRDLLKLAGCSLALGLSSLRDAHADGKLVVTHFGGPYAALDKLLGKPFGDAGLGSVSYESELSTAALGKMQAGVAPFDVAMLSRAPALRAGRAGLVIPIAREELPNLKDTIDGTYVGNGFGVTMVMDSISLAVNKKQASIPIESWLDLWRPELAGKIALPAARVSMPSALIAMLARSIGGNYKDEKAVDEVFKRLVALKKNVRVFYNDPAQATTLIERGEIAVAPQFSLRVSALLRTSSDVARITPKEGVIAAPYDLVIVKGSKEPALAKRYIDFVLSKESQTSLATSLLAPPVNRSVSLPAEVSGKVLTDTSKLIFLDEDYMATKQTEWLTRWERQVQA
jgi:putative spermidine/putrescine transport system substrate-binding protein